MDIACIKFNKVISPQKHVYMYVYKYLLHLQKDKMSREKLNEPVHEISNNVVCANSKASDQPAQTRSLIRAFASRLSILGL